MKKTYFDQWHDIYFHRKPERFWEFIGTIREANVPPESYALTEIYKYYFTENTDEKSMRVSPELMCYFLNLETSFVRYQFMFGAKQRIKFSIYGFCLPEMTDEQFENWWNSDKVKFQLRYCPDRLTARHVLERVHILACDLHADEKELLDL